MDLLVNRMVVFRERAPIEFAAKHLVLVKVFGVQKDKVRIFAGPDFKNVAR